MSDAFREAMIALMPALTAFAMAKTRSKHDADDLVQDTLARALRYSASFKPGTNMKSWLCRIMQNVHNRDRYKDRNTVQDVEGRLAALLSTAASQHWRVEYTDVIDALQHLTPDARDALMLVGADGCSYEEAAELSDCPVGTLKSRVNRARERLAELTGYNDSHKSPPLQPFRPQALQMSFQQTGSIYSKIA